MGEKLRKSGRIKPHEKKKETPRKKAIRADLGPGPSKERRQLLKN